MLGQMAVRSRGSEIEISSAKAKALMAFLSLSPNRASTRDALADLLWGDSDSIRAGNSLRQTLKILRDSVERASPGVFATPGREVRVRDDRIEVDCEVLLEAISAGEIPRSLLERDSLADTMMLGLDGLSIEFDRFLSVERSRYQDRLAGELRKALQSSPPESDARGDAARALRNIDPTNEFASRSLMQWYWVRGEPFAATKVYYELCEALDELDGDAEPSAETDELLRRIKLGLSDDAEQAGPVKPDALLPAIAVERISLDGLPAEVEKLAVAFRFDLIRVMSRFREWRVVDRMTVSETADYTLECHVSPDSRFVTLLKSEATGRYLWSESAQLTFENWRSAQGDIVLTAANAIDVHISEDRVAAASTAVPDRRQAFDKWVTARSLIGVWRPDAHERASTLIGEIVAEQPDFAQGHAELAVLSTARHLFRPGLSPETAVLATAERHAAIATRLDPLDAKAKRALGWARLMQRRFSEAERDFAAAIRLNASDPLTLISSALGLAYCESADEARSAVDRGLALQPEPLPFLRGYILTILILDGDDEAALELAGSAGAMVSLQGWEAIARWRLGDKAGAAAAAARFLAISRANWAKAAPPDPAELISWFCDSFPIRSARTKAEFANALTGAFAQ